MNRKPYQPSVKKNYEVQRKVNTKRHRKNKRKRLIIFYIFLIVSFLSIGSFFVINKFFKISKIEVFNTKQYNYSQVLQAANLKIGENIFKYKSTTISNNLKSKLIFVDNAVVKKKLPNKIIINVVDAKAKYFIKIKSKIFLISNNMKILESHDKNFNLDGLTEIKGISIKNKNVGEFISTKDEKIIILNKLNKVLKKYNFKDITKINLISRSNIGLSYQDRINILIGNYIQLDYKIKFVKTIINKNIDKNEKGTIDATGVLSFSKVYFAPYKEVKKEEHSENINENSELSQSESGF